MTARELSSSELCDLFPAGSVMHNPVTGEYARVIEHTPERAVGESGEDDLRARVTLTPPGLFAGMIGAVWGLAVLGRTNAKGMPKLADAALLAETFANEIVFERPPRAVQRALAVTVAPIARRRGRSVTGETMRAAIVPAAQWPGRF
jgi:hypothetical protein